MKKTAFLLFACLFFIQAFSQVTVDNPVPTTKTIKLPNRPADHLMLQLSSDHWTGMPDSISSHQSGFSRGFNAYFMLDKPFRSSPKYSIGFGLGISSSNIVFKKMNVGIEGAPPVLHFTAEDSTSHFQKYKLSTSYAEVPIEFRFTSNPDNVNKSLKAAIGVKVGTLLNTHTKGKTLQDKNNTTINSFAEKINSKRFMNTTRFTATARLGYGIFSIFGSYQLNNLLKDGAGADMKLYQIGITLSGL
ncbi:MAG: outer membrane beta-barrel protein [Ginsengibacter sp.]